MPPLSINSYHDVPYDIPSILSKESLACEQPGSYSVLHGGKDIVMNPDPAITSQVTANLNPPTVASIGSASTLPGSSSFTNIVPAPSNLPDESEAPASTGSDSGSDPVINSDPPIPTPCTEDLKLLPASEEEVQEFGYYMQISDCSERRMLTKEVDPSKERPVFKKQKSDLVLMDQFQRLLDLNCSLCGGFDNEVGYSDKYSYHKIYGSDMHIKPRYSYDRDSIWRPSCEWFFSSLDLEIVVKVHNKSFDGMDCGWRDCNKERTLLVWYNHLQKVTLEKENRICGKNLAVDTKRQRDFQDNIVKFTVPSKEMEKISMKKSSRELFVSVGVLSKDNTFIFVLYENRRFVQGDEFYFYRLCRERIVGILDLKSLKPLSITIEDALKRNGDEKLLD